MTRAKSRIGRIYKKRNKRPDGTFIDHTTWTVRYKGKDYATGETNVKEAEKFLLRLAGDIARETPRKKWNRGMPDAQTDTAPAAPAKSEPSVVLMSEVLDLFLADSERRKLASAPGNNGIVDNYLRPFFGHIPVTDLTTKLFNRYIDQRIAAEKTPTPATVNREMAALKRALNHAMREQDPPLLQRYPHITMLPESEPRKGLLSSRDYEKLRHALPDYWEPVFVTAYHVGRRRGELLQLEIEDVDFHDGQIRVSGSITKNGKPSAIPIYTPDMVRTLEKQIQLTRRDFPGCKLLFHKNGQSIHKNQTFYDEWKSACAAVGLHGLLFHDLRRTACKMLIDAGNSRPEAMLITGHLTESAFTRYHIMDQRSLKTAANRAAVFLAAQQQAAKSEPASGLVS